MTTDQMNAMESAKVAAESRACVRRVLARLAEAAQAWEYGSLDIADEKARKASGESDAAWEAVRLRIDSGADCPDWAADAAQAAADATSAAIEASAKAWESGVGASRAAEKARDAARAWARLANA